MTTATVSLAAVRRRVVSAQGYAGRFRRAGAAELEETIRRLAAVQLDSISTVDRAHRLTLSARIGAFAEAQLQGLVASGRVFEYWAHEACLLPIEDYPLHRWRMARYATVHPWRGNVFEREPELTERVLAEIRERGALGSRDFEGDGSGGMWNWKPAKVVLEALHSAGRLAIAGRDGFQRLYDLPERVLPDEVLGSATPTDDEFVRWATLRGVEARGALTESAVAEMWRLAGGAARIRPHADALVAEGKLVRAEVEDGKAPVLLPAGEPDEGPLPQATLLCPFDNLLWDRGFVERVLGFRHLIEVYKREHERQFGYYVLPLLAGDRIVGRADVKADRKEGVLRVLRFTPEPRARGNVGAKLERAAARLARVLALDEVRHA